MNVAIYSFPALHYGPIMTAPLRPSNSSAGNLTSRAVAASCNNQITPTCLQSLYGIPTTLATQKSNTLAVTGYIDQYANQADLQVQLLIRDRLIGLTDFIAIVFLEEPSSYSQLEYWFHSSDY